MKFSFLFYLIFTMACGTPQGKTQIQNVSTSTEQVDLSKYNRAYFASGCFWCVEAIFESVEGVAEAISGYQGGKSSNPTYEQIGTGMTGHAEAVEVYYDPSKVDYKTLLKVFFGSHDPTTLNRQGPDRGTQYRSAIFYQSQEEKDLIDEYIAELKENKVFNGPITTEVAEYTTFWKAEDYHQNYEMRNPNNPYVKAVSIPRLKKFQAKFPELLKVNH